MSKKLFIGIMTGTSADGIDIALVSVTESFLNIIDSQSQDLADDIQAEIKALCQPCANELFRAHSLGIKLSLICVDIINTIIKKNCLSPQDITAIGFHGQTIRHHPDTHPAFSIQIGCPSTLAHHTKIKTIADFRMADIAAGGQGAPLVPAFHMAAFHSESENRLIINIGGIANISYLPANKDFSPSGFDTGPGNTLLDEWIFKCQQKTYDFEGQWATTGSIIPNLIEDMMSDKYVLKPAPKSTGKEYFNLDWLEDLLKLYPKSKNEDIQRTLLEFTCLCISSSVRSIVDDSNSNKPFCIYLCGGGINNSFLVERLARLNKNIDIKSTLALGIHPQLVEASAFAWLASRTNLNLPSNLKSATGADSDKVLGGIYPA